VFALILIVCNRRVLLALFAFNVGVETGQLAFIASVLSILLGCGAVFATALVYRVLSARLSRWLTRE
jgi:HupE / UreJ protein